MSDTLSNAERQVLYHGTSLKAAEKIAREGFKVWFYLDDDEPGERCCSGGNLGNGIYITHDWRVALAIGGPVLLRVALHPGTKLLDASLPPDTSVIKYLRREFGHEVLSKSPWKSIPDNKNLTLSEFIALFRYHYWTTWEKAYGTASETFYRWPAKRELHLRLVKAFRTRLVRYGFHGYGNPKDDNGIVVIAEDRLKPVEIIGNLSEDCGVRYWEAMCPDFKFTSVQQIREQFQLQGSSSVKALVERFAAADQLKLPSRVLKKPRGR